MARRTLFALVLTLAVAAFAGTLAPPATQSEVACGDEEKAPPEDSEALERFVCGDEEKSEQPDDQSTLRLA